MLVTMKSKSTVIYDYLEEKIVKGTLKSGDKLPSESELCEKFSVSRGPVRAALDKLSAIGLVFKKKGGGSYVSEQGMDNFLNAVLPTLKFNTDNYNEMQELRTALDKLSIELCLKNHETNDYDKLDKIIKSMKKNHNKEEFFKLDRGFHTAISLLSGNQLLHSINLLVWDLLENISKEEYYSDNMEEIIIEHMQIYRSIKENDLELAILYISRHLKKTKSIKPSKVKSEEDKKRWNPWLSNTL